MPAHREIGLPILRRDHPHQGAQEEIDLFGEGRTVDFHNSYAARCGDATVTELAAHDVGVSRNPHTGDVHGLRGPGFAGVQFHSESALTLGCAGIIAGLLDVVTTGATAETVE